MLPSVDTAHGKKKDRLDRAARTGEARSLRDSITDTALVHNHAVTSWPAGSFEYISLHAPQCIVIGPFVDMMTSTSPVRGRCSSKRIEKADIFHSD